MNSVVKKGGSEEKLVCKSGKFRAGSKRVTKCYGWWEWWNNRVGLASFCHWMGKKRFFQWNYCNTLSTAFFQNNLGKPVPERLNQSGFIWGKRWWGFGMQWNHLDHTQIICTLFQRDYHTNTASLIHGKNHPGRLVFVENLQSVITWRPLRQPRCWQCQN